MGCIEVRSYNPTPARHYSTPRHFAAVSYITSAQTLTQQQEIDHAPLVWDLNTGLSIHRLAEVMTRAGSEADLIRNALDTMADATGFARWALFRKDRRCVGMHLKGSGGMGTDDEYSDVDLEMVVEDAHYAAISAELDSAPCG